MRMKEVVIADYLRTPFSRSRPKEPEKDKFNSYRMDELLARLVKTLVERNKINQEEIGDLIVGCALGVGENWTYAGRIIVVLAGLSVHVPAMQMDRQCGSSLSAAQIGAMEIMTGNSDIVVAGGMEHMTHVPMQDNPHFIPNLNVLKQTKYDMQTGFVMGQTAEKLAVAERKFTREEMDQFSLGSHQKAAKALKEGFFKDELMPIEVKEKDGTTEIVDHDLSIRPDTTIEQLRQLPPVFKPKTGLITAGNSSPLNAGASAVILMSREKADDYGIKPMATIKSMGWAGVEPYIMGKGIVPASQKALKQAGLDVDDIDYWEINEAFAVVALYAMDKLKIDPKKVNINGGGVAIGHPLGATGARLIGTSARTLKMRNAKYGLATACIGGGQGASMILERA
jgi:acetyl-CoA acetyltransferase family protein